MPSLTDKILKLLRGVRRGNRKLAAQFDVNVDRINMDDRQYIIDMSNQSIDKAFVAGYILGRYEVSKLIAANVDIEEYQEVPEDCSGLIAKLVDRELKKVKR